MFLDNLRGPSQADAIDRIKAARAPAESLDQPADTFESDTPSETEIDVLETMDQAEAELVESESEVVDDEQPQDDDQDLYVDLDGREISLKQIQEWEQGALRQSDYTRKTQAIAEDRKAIEAEKAEVTNLKSALTENITMLEELLKEQDATVDMEELREYDPSEYLKQKELQQSRQERLAKARESLNQVDNKLTQEQVAKEQSILISNNPHWLKDGKETEEYKKDMSLINDYLSSSGFTPEDQKGITSAKQWQAIIDAAKYRASLKKGESIKAKVKKAPIVPKPKTSSQSNQSIEIKRAHERHKREQSTSSALNLRKTLKKYSN
jgi:hypothetical protein